MSAMNIDKSLDDIIKTRPRRGMRRGRGRVANTSTRRRSSGITKRSTVAPVTRAPATVPVVKDEGSKIIVSNLPFDVTEAQVIELFAETVGPLKKVTLNYGPSGQSKGSATVIFQRKGDATKAFQQYNGRLIDQKRPMKVEIVVDPTRIAQTTAVPIKQRISAAEPNTTTGSTTTRTGKTAGRRGRGGRTRGRGGRSRSSQPIKTTEQLDAEMEEYFASGDNGQNATASATAVTDAAGDATMA